jgi:hypothetical protein
VSVLSNVQVALNFSLSASGSALALNSASFNASAAFRYSAANAQFRAAGIVTPSDMMLIVEDVPIGAVGALVSGIVADAAAAGKGTTSTTIAATQTALGYLSSNAPAALSSAVATFSISTFPSAYCAPLLSSVPSGVSISLQSFQLASSAFGGAVSPLLAQLDPNYDMTFALTLSLPVHPVAGGGLQTVENGAYSFALRAGGVQIDDLTLSALTLTFAQPAAAGAMPVFTAQATLQLALPALAAAPLTINGALTVGAGSTTFVGSVQGALNALSFPWITLSNPTLTMSIRPPASVAINGHRYSFALGASVQFTLDSAAASAPPPPIPVQLAAAGGVWAISATGVSMANIFPALASYTGVAAAQPVDLIFTNANGSDPLTVARIAASIRPAAAHSTSGGFHTQATSSGAASLSSLSPLLASLPPLFAQSEPGLNLFAQNVALSSSGSGALAMLGSAVGGSGVKLNMTVYLPLSGSSAWQVTLQTSASLALSSLFSLNNVFLAMSVQPAPLAASAELGGQMVMALPFSSSHATFGVLGAYDTRRNNLTFEGAFPSWPTPFGLSFLTFSPTTVEFASYQQNGAPAHAASLSTAVSLNGGQSVGVCGALLDKDLILSVDNVGAAPLASTLCQLLGVCSSNGIFDVSSLVGSGSIPFGLQIATSSLVLDNQTAYDVFCNVPNTVTWPPRTLAPDRSALVSG